jgi:putative membrane protein
MLIKRKSSSLLLFKDGVSGLPNPYLFMLWALAMIALPILKYLFAEAGLRFGLMVGVLIQVWLVLALIAPAWGVAQTVRMAGLVAGLSWAIEALGSTTGIPFGRYHYTDFMQPQLWGVPLLIPLAWLMMLPSAWAIAAVLTNNQFGLAFIGWSALAMTAWDLFLDPQMVAWGLWVWAEPGGYFGIPWVNFLGWLVASGLITAIVRPNPLPIRPLTLIYGVTWLLETGGLFFFWGLPGPAMVGFIGMGGMLWLTAVRKNLSLWVGFGK